MNPYTSGPVADDIETPALVDARGRRISYLRVSVTDRCNMSCFYCKRSDARAVPRARLLPLAELDRIVSTFVRLGVRKVRLTGGEPLVRPDISMLVHRLGRHVYGGALDELTLTTNGSRLARHAADLMAAGVRRVNVSLDSLDRDRFMRITGRDDLPRVLEGIEAARAAGLAVRLNTVAMAGVNDGEFDALLRWCGQRGCDLALIEMMPLGPSMARHLPLAQVRERLAQRWTLLPLAYRSAGPGRYWQVLQTGRRLAFIEPLGHGFCAGCNRMRLTCTGTLVPCLGHGAEVDLRPALAEGLSRDGLEAAIRAAVSAKPAGHHFNAGERPVEIRPMWQLGG